MDIQNRRTLKQASREALLRASYDPKKLILIHTGVILLVSLLVLVVDYLLERQISDTGGLGGLGTRTILETAQSVLRLGQIVALPFWQLGYLAATVEIARGRRADASTLLEGFRRFLPALRLMLIQGVVYLGIGFVAMYAGSFLFMMTPWAKPLMEAVQEAVGGGIADPDAMYAAVERVVEQVAGPIMVFFLLAFAVLAAPVFYRFRLTQYCLLEHTEKGALAAIQESRRRMRGNCLSMVKLDLSFWWFWALDLLVTGVSYLDLLLPLAGITLPWSAEVKYFGAFLLYSLCQLGLYWWRRNEVEVTYAYAYEALIQE